MSLKSELCDDGVNFPDVMDSDTEGELGCKHHTRGLKLKKGKKVFFILSLLDTSGLVLFWQD